MNYSKILIAGLTASTIMTAFMLLVPLVGLPKMDVGLLLGAMFDGNQTVGWILHFILGTIFVIPYVLFFNRWIPVENKWLRGTIYGILVFVFSEIILIAINLTGHLNSIERLDMAKMICGNALACMIYGAVMGAFFERTGMGGMERAKHTG